MLVSFPAAKWRSLCGAPLLRSRLGLAQLCYHGILNISCNNDKNNDNSNTDTHV